MLFPASAPHIPIAGVFAARSYGLHDGNTYICLRAGVSAPEHNCKNDGKMKRRLGIVADDEWLVPVEDEIEYRHGLYESALAEAERIGGSLAGYADGHLCFGFQRDEAARGWWFREWLPGAGEVYLFGDMNGWDRRSLPLTRGGDGVWSIFLYDGDYGRGVRHGALYKILVKGADGTVRERIPAYASRVVQDDRTKDFTAQVWLPEPFDWAGDSFDAASLGTLYIYECHIGMATEREGVGSFAEFTQQVLPRIAADGYNAVQIMGLAEHPYYGSFGYHVSSFFAPSSRFGTPEDLKTLVREAHRLGLAVIMDIVHAHYVKNLNEGINALDGDPALYSPSGEAGVHPYWDSMVFDYAKPQVRRFLLSNLRYWMEEYRMDGFRFDGVTSMIYRHHGYTEFDCREKYFGPDVDSDALTYLSLANTLVHGMRLGAVTIAEDVSGMPGMCRPVADGGVGFDYRLGMAVPDFWIRMLKEVPDEEWSVNGIWNILTDRLSGVGTVAYAESHDQAMVGDQTIAFRLMGSDMYVGMERGSENAAVERGMALHKMIRFVTLSLGGQAYLNFMGNEFGHPEWIDFPREGNGWSYKYARRQWSLADDPELRYSQLGAFDRAMIRFAERYGIMRRGYAYARLLDEENKTMAFDYGDLLFVFNWHPTRSTAGFTVEVPQPGRYQAIFSTDEGEFGGADRISADTVHFSFPVAGEDGHVRHYISIYNVCRTACVYGLMPEEK